MGHIQASSLEQDRAAVLAAAMDYIESAYEADPPRMERCLHPDLIKRIARSNPDGTSRLDHMSALGLINYVRSRPGPAPLEQCLAKAEVLDLFTDIASVRVEMERWVDYMHLCRWNGAWKITNVLWQMKA